MKTWTVYFEIFGKKMKTEVKADSFYAAQCKVRDKIVFHKTVEKPGADPDIFSDLFGGMFSNMKK